MNGITISEPRLRHLRDLREWHIGRKLSEETKKKISESHIGKKLSIETRKKMRGRIPWNKGKIGSQIHLPHTEETKEKIRKSKLGKKKTIEERRRMSERASKRKGHLNPNWKGGLTPLSLGIRSSFKYRQWRSDVFTRDKFTCQWCNDARGGNLEVDHIKPLRLLIQYYEIINIEQALKCEAIWDINNGRTLCFRCHKKTESFGTTKTYQLDLI